MKVFGYSDIGPHRPSNQDYFDSAPLPLPPKLRGVKKREENALLAVVCDGMGGVRGGEIASHLATSTFIEKMKEETQRDALGALEDALSAANGAVYSAAEENEALRGMGSTMVAALVYERALAILNVGDSRIYLWHAGHLLLLTHDHSYVQAMVDAGKMSADEARYSLQRNVITRAVGTRPAVFGDVAYSSWEEGDRLLLCTDGVSGVLSDADIAEVLSADMPIERAARELTEKAVLRGSEDNLTALLIENTKENPECLTQVSI